MKDYKTTHEENLKRLARIEGQVRGLQRMIAEGEYCIDIITQIQAVRAALKSVSRNILKKHIEHCLFDAAKSGDEADMRVKIDEILKVLKRGSI